MSMDMEEIVYHNAQRRVKLDLKSLSVTHIYAGEEVVSALTEDGETDVWVATFGCARLAARFVRVLQLLGDIEVPAPDRRQFVGKRKQVATVGR